MSTQSLIEQTLATVDLALELEPREIFANARIHLADARMTGGDVAAWFLLCQFQDAFFEGKTAECHWCGEIEFFHKYGYCPNRMGGTFTPEAK